VLAVVAQLGYNNEYMPYYEYTPEQLTSEDTNEFPAPFCRAIGATSVRYEVQFVGRGGSDQLHAWFVEARNANGELIRLDSTQADTFDVQLTNAMRERAH